MFRTKDISGTPKYAGRSKGKVIDNRDPLQRGRIRVDHPLIDKNIWLDYLNSPSQFSAPSIGHLVYVEADSGNPEYCFAWGNAVKGLTENPEIPTEFKRDIPTNRGLYTPNGHKLEMDDGEATPSNEPKDNDFTTKGRGIRVTSAAGNKIHIIEDEDAGNQYILLQDAGGNIIKLDYKNNELTIKSIGKTKLETTGDQEETVGGNLVINVTGDTTVNSTGNVTIASDGAAAFSGAGQTTVGDNGSQTLVNGSQVLIAGGGPGVARLGDRAFGIGNLGSPVSSTIIQGSSKALSG